MRIASITAGAAGMFCGSCMRDNTLVTALRTLGHDALLIPTYTPIRTDEVDVSQERVFFGGVNVYLQEKFWLFRHTPWLLDRLLDARGLLRWVSRFASSTPYSELGSLTISMLQGTHGHQSKEVEKLTLWLQDEVKPEVVLLTNVLLSGIAPRLRERLNVPVIATLQGDDIFLDALHDQDRRRCLALIRENCKSIDGFISTSEHYADFMSQYVGIDRSKIHVVYPGINLNGFAYTEVDRSTAIPTIGYLARICPEKGFHHLVEAFIKLRQVSTVPYRLRVSGWLGDNMKGFFEQQVQRLTTAGLQDSFAYIPTPDHDSKVEFLRECDLFSVPTTYREPKGLYLLEAWAMGLPVVQPEHGSFPELVRATGGGILVKPNDTDSLMQGWRDLLEKPTEARSLGKKAREVVADRFHSLSMAQGTLQVLDRHLQSHGNANN